MHWQPNPGANNSTGFTALPGGRLGLGGGGKFSGIGTQTVWWTTTTSPYGASTVVNVIEISPGYLFYYGTDKNQGFSVRCSRDSSTGSMLPVLSSDNVSAITPTTSAAGGTIINEGSSAVIARGVTWSTTPIPNLLDPNTKTINGTGVGHFTSNITGLIAATTYYVWAYATNSSGTTYSTYSIFTTLPPVIPPLTALSISNIANTSAVANITMGNIYAGPAITAKGLVWSTTPNPTIIGSKTIDGTGTGSFTSNLSALLPNTVYYIRAYATNSTNTYYGNEINFKTLDPNFPALTIGSQIWTTKNLDLTTYRNGDIIPQVTDKSTWSSLTTGAWCWYNNDSATYATTYGKLYNWYAVTDPRGLAPLGWHVPTNAEWTTLSTALGGDAIAGNAMKEAGETHWLNPNTGATNSSGFTGLPGGYLPSVGAGTFSKIGISGTWWTSTNNGPNTTTIMMLTNNVSSLTTWSNWKSYGCSVRCVRD
jgi:uncharacterized protein (TIGR02145 family)